MEEDEVITLADGTTLTNQQARRYKLWLSGVLEIQRLDGTRVWYSPFAWTAVEGGKHRVSPNT